MSQPPFDQGPNPYSSPRPQSYEETPLSGLPPVAPYEQGRGLTKEDTPGQPWDMNYFGFMEMIQRNPSWITNSFLTGVCGMIPIVGLIVIWGYTYENAAILHRSTGQQQWPFDFGRFGDYLKRGVGPFLVWFISASPPTSSVLECRSWWAG